MFEYLAIIYPFLFCIARRLSYFCNDRKARSKAAT